MKERSITIKAKSQNYAMEGVIQLLVDNKPINEWYLQPKHSSNDEYKAKVFLEDGEHSVDILLLKKGDSKPYIERIEIDGKIYLPNDAIYYDKGLPWNPSSSLDGKDTIPGGNNLETEGGLRFNINLDSAIELTEDELSAILEGENLPKQFSDGSLIEDTKTNTPYLILRGEKREISKNYLSFYGASISRREDLSHIEEGEAFPKYPENAIITINTTKYLYTQGKKLKFDNVEELTKDGFTPESGNVPITIKMKNWNSPQQIDVPLQLWVDGKMVKEWGPIYQGGYCIQEVPEFTANLTLSPSKHKIEVIFPKIGSVSPIVDYIQIGDKKIEVEEGGGTYDRGEPYKYSQFNDGKDVSRSQETITSPGALRFEVDILPSISVSKEELANIPDFIKVQSSVSSLKDTSLISPPWYEPYENSENKIQALEEDSLEGKFIKYDDNVFYVMNGRKRPILDSIDGYLPEEKRNEIVNVSKERIINLKTDKPLPIIKFHDGQLITDIDLGTFIVFSGIKHRIDPSKFSALGIDLGNVVNAYKKDIPSIPTGEPIPDPRIVTDGKLGNFLIINSERRYIPDDYTLNKYLQALSQESVEKIKTKELLSYAPKEALNKIEPPPPPPPPPKKKKWYQKLWSSVSSVVSTIVRGIPVVGQIYAFASSITGRDLITGNKLSGVDRWLSLLSPLARGASLFNQTKKLAGLITKGNDALSKLNQYSSYLTGKDLSGNPISIEERVLGSLNLTKRYDLGSLTDITNKVGSMYNNLIENKYYKFGTALTGKDLWMNELSWQERLSGIKSYQRNSDFNFEFNKKIEEILFKDKINLPKIDLPKIDIDGLNNFSDKLALRNVAEQVVNMGRRTEGGIEKVIEKVIDSFNKPGIDKEKLEEAVREKLIWDEIEQFSKRMETKYNGNDVLEGSEDYKKLVGYKGFIEKILSDTYPNIISRENTNKTMAISSISNKEDKDILPELTKDLADFALSLLLKKPWTAVKVLYYLAVGEEKKALTTGILAFDPTHFIKWIKKELDLVAKYGGYIVNAMEKRFEENLGERKYEFIFKEYYYTYPMNEVSREDFLKKLESLPTGRFFVIDFLYYEKYNKHIISDDEWPKGDVYKKVKEYIEGKI